MKRIALVVLLVLVCSVSANAEEQFDGYAWEQLDETEKFYFLSGYISGHRQGEYFGRIKGHFEGVNEVISITKDMKADLAVAMVVKKMGERMRNKIKNREIDLSLYEVSAPSKMVGELDAFYKTYPLCKSKRLDLMLSDFIKIWRKDDKKTYKEVGEGCSE